MNLSITNLHKRYGKVAALRGVDLAVTGGMFGLLGPNGAGKTTLLRILVGLAQPTEGQVRIGGEDVTREPGKTRIRRTLGYLPQDLGFYPDLTARQFLDYVAVLKEMDQTPQRRRRVAEVLAMVGLAADADRRLKTFSGGMKRRVGIAQALLADPSVLVVDEPTVGLDPEERVRFRNLLADLAGDRLVLLSTHIVEDISQTCRELAILQEGQIRFRGTPGELIEQARGTVWELELPIGQRLAPGQTVVGTIHLGDRTRYRVIGSAPPAPEAQAVAPTLEDAYMWLMESGRSRDRLVV